MSVARFTPMPHHCAGPKHFVNGGIIATILDCHCVCTAAAMTYRDDGREIGSQPEVYCATTRLEVEYRRPTPMGVELTLAARILERLERGYVLSCRLEAAGKECVTAQVEAVRVPESWVLGRGAGN